VGNLIELAERLVVGRRRFARDPATAKGDFNAARLQKLKNLAPFGAFQGLDSRFEKFDLSLGETAQMNKATEILVLHGLAPLDDLRASLAIRGHTPKPAGTTVPVLSATVFLPATDR